MTLVFAELCGQMPSVFLRPYVGRIGSAGRRTDDERLSHCSWGGTWERKNGDLKSPLSNRGGMDMQIFLGSQDFCRLIYELIFFIQFAMKLLEWIFFDYFLPA